MVEVLLLFFTTHIAVQLIEVLLFMPLLYFVLIYVLLYIILYVDCSIFTTCLQYFVRYDNNKALFVVKWSHIPCIVSNNEH